MNALAQLICSRVRAEIFRVLFGLRTGEVHLRELHRQTGLAIGTVRQDIETLARIGLVTRRKAGNRVYYAANPRHPLSADIHQLVLKTAGLSDVLAAALRSDRIQCAFVFGSVAAGTATAESDIDLMVIGQVSLRQTSSLLSGVGQQLGREINSHVLTPSEFDKRIRSEDHFLTSVLASPKFFVVGSQDDITTMGG